MKNNDNRRPYNGIEPKDGEQLVPVLAHELLEWDKECIERGLSKPGQLLKRENLETWHYGERKILVGFVSVKNEEAPAALEAFRIARNQYIEETRKQRCLIMKNGQLIRCPKSESCTECLKFTNSKFERVISRTISLDEQEENMKNPNKKGYDFTGSKNNSPDTNFLAYAFLDLIEGLRNCEENYAKILELTHEGYTKAEILKKINFTKGKSQGYEYIAKAFKAAKDILEEKGYTLSDFIE